MVGVSIAGLILALLQLGECSLVQYGVLDRQVPTTIVFELEDPNAASNPFTIWFDNLESTLQQFQQDYLKYDNTNFNPDNKLTIDLSDTSIHATNLVLNGRYDGDSVPDNITLGNIRPENTSGQSLKPLTTLADFLKKQSIIHHETRKLIKNKKKENSNDYDFHLIYTDSGPSPVYIDGRSVSMNNNGRGESNTIKSRVKRQAVLDVPIPVARSFYAGTDEEIDNDCARNGVEMEDEDEEDDYQGAEQKSSYYEDEDDRCFEVLSRGPCRETEIVLVNPLTKKGICGPRLCSPDRVFMFGDQLCHDPHQLDACDNGRQLFSTGFGTPICGCEDGFYELETGKNSYDDVCQPLLTEIPNCDPGKVFWFKSFKDPPACLSDPCKGLNLNRKYSALPYAPSLVDGNCYQIGSTPKICRYDEYFALDLPKLKGVCQSLEEAGYLTLDSKTLDNFKDLYGSSLLKESTSRRKVYSKPMTPKIGWPVVEPLPPTAPSMVPLFIGQSVVGPRIPVSPSQYTLIPTHVTSHSPAYIAIGGNVTVNVFESEKVPVYDNPWKSIFGKSAAPSRQQLIKGDESKKTLRRFKRAPQPHASPGNVFEPALSSCRAGAVRDINQKCRSTILPSRVPHSRPRRATRPVRPFPSCPSGNIRSLRRRCTSSTASVQSSIIARGLG